jgi:hypothetical protein
MKILLLSLSLALASTVSLLAGDSAAEKAFVEKFKTAYEANDKATLESFLYKEGAHPMALEFYRMMLTEGAGGKISKIELVDLTPEELKKAEGIQEGPDGQKTKMPIKPTKKLNIKVDMSSGDSSGSSTSSPLVAEKGGKFVIPVPAPAK